MKNVHVPSTRLRRSLATAAAATLTVGGLVVVATPASAVARTIYVSSDGEDVPTCGRLVFQCATIQTGIDRAAPGDTVQVAAGSYNEALRIEKGISLVAAPGSRPEISGAGRKQVDPLTYGTIYVGSRTTTAGLGQVTISGFTIRGAVSQGQVPSDVEPEYPAMIVLRDGEPKDAITIQDNVLVGSGDEHAGEIAVMGRDNRASVTVEDNDISRTWMGVSSRDGGHLTVSGNSMSDLVPWDPQDDSFVYPGRGVSIVHSVSSMSEQRVVDNAFTSYSGYGVSFQNMGGFSNGPLSISGRVTGNTFALTDRPGDVARGIAIQLSTNTDNPIDLQMGDNTGTVGAGNLTVVQSGAVNLKQLGSVSSIRSVPGARVDMDAPVIVAQGADGAGEIRATVQNPGTGRTYEPVRLGLVLHGPQGLDADDVTVRYGSSEDEDENLAEAKVTKDAAGDLVAYLSEPSELRDGAEPTDVKVRLALAADAPTGPLSIATALVSVAGDGETPVNREATDEQQSQIVRPASVFEKVTVSPATLTTATTPVLTVPVFSVGSTAGGTVTVKTGSITRTGTVSQGKATVTLPKLAGGSHTVSIAYGGTATSDEASTITKTLKVAKVKGTISSVLAPTKVRSTTTRPKITITVRATGTTAAGGTVKVLNGRSTVASGKVGTKGTVTLTLPRLKAGKRTWTLSYGGNANVLAGTKKLTFTVVK